MKKYDRYTARKCPDGQQFYRCEDADREIERLKREAAEVSATLDQVHHALDLLGVPRL